MFNFTKGPYEFDAYAYNNTDRVTTAINCWIGEIEVGGYVGFADIPWELPAGIHKGMTRDELVETMSKLGMHEEDTEDSNGKTTYFISIFTPNDDLTDNLFTVIDSKTLSSL